MRIPKGFQFKSDAKPSLFDYPAHIKPDDKKKQTKKETVQLSITQKAKARAAAKKQAEGGEEIEPEKKETGKMDVEEPKDKEEEKKKEEPPFKICDNHSRVLPKQENSIIFLEDNRYTPVLKNRKRGIIFLLDKKPGEREEFFDMIGDPVADPHLIPPEEFTFDEEAQLTK